MIAPPVEGQPVGGNPNIPPGAIPSDGGNFGYTYGTTPPGCYASGKTPGGCIPGNIQGGGNPGMVPDGGYDTVLGSPPPAMVLQGCGPGIIPYCGGPGSRRISGGSGGIGTMARSSIPTTIFLSTIVVLLLHMTMTHSVLLQ